MLATNSTRASEMKSMRLFQKFMDKILSLIRFVEKKIANYYAKKFIGKSYKKNMTSGGEEYEYELVIGIVTFKDRFELYLKGLIESIRLQDTEIPIIIAVNGNHKEKFDDKYRRDMLEYAARYPGVFLRFYPHFNGLTKIWNDIILSTAARSTLILNDDVSFMPGALTEIKVNARESVSSFKINNSWSHYVLYRKDFWEVGPFDQRLLGVGEEDGDYEWRFSSYRGFDFPSKNIMGINNHVDYSHSEFRDMGEDFGAVGNSGKYSSFNHHAMYSILYNVDYINGDIKGICPLPLIPANKNNNEITRLDRFWIEFRAQL